MSVQIALMKCPLCGLPSEEPVCERCNTVIAWEKATCPICGRMYSSSIAVCEVCDEALRGPTELDDEERELKNLTMIAGISKVTAKALVMQGICDFSELVKLALPPRAVRMGLHRTIARRMMMAEFIRQGKKVEDGHCPICSNPYDPETGFCPKCKYSPLPEQSEEWIKERLEKVAGEVEDLCSDPDFLAMPEPVRKRVLAEINGMLQPIANEEQLVAELETVFGCPEDRDEKKEPYRHQIELWKTKGFDVAALERLLDEDVEKFRKNCVKIIRRQIRKKQKEFEYVCPLCDAGVKADSKACPNCGALFD